MGVCLPWDVPRRSFLQTQCPPPPEAPLSGERTCPRYPQPARPAGLVAHTPPELRAGRQTGLRLIPCVPPA